MCFTWTAFSIHWPVSFIFMPASCKTCPPYPACVVYSLLIGPKTISLTALTLSLAHAPNRETLPLKTSRQNTMTSLFRAHSDMVADQNNQFVSSLPCGQKLSHRSRPQSRLKPLEAGQEDQVACSVAVWSSVADMYGSL